MEEPEVLSCPSRQLQSLLRRFTAGTDDDEWRRTRLPCFYGKSNMFTCFTWVPPEGRVTDTSDDILTNDILLYLPHRVFQ